MVALTLVKEQIPKKNVWLQHEEPELFVVSRWQDPSKVTLWYLVVRWILALYHTSWWLYLLISSGGVESSFARKMYFFIYLTNWSYSVITFMNIYWAIVETKAYRKYKLEGRAYSVTGPTLRGLWTLQNITYLPAFLVSTIYWTFLFHAGSGISPGNAEAHMMNTIYSVWEILFSATPIRLYHIYQPVIYLLIYVFFSLFYYLGGGTTADGLHYIYPVLDWEDPSATLKFIALGALGCIGLQVIVWMLYFVREYCYRKFFGQKYNGESNLVIFSSA